MSTLDDMIRSINWNDVLVPAYEDRKESIKKEDCKNFGNLFESKICFQNWYENEEW